MGGLNNEGAKARDPDLMQLWRDTRDPLKLATARLLKERVISPGDVTRIQEEAEHEAEAVEAFADASPKATPDIAELLAGVYAA